VNRYLLIILWIIAAGCCLFACSGDDDDDDDDASGDDTADDDAGGDDDTLDDDDDDLDDDDGVAPDDDDDDASDDDDDAPDAWTDPETGLTWLRDVPAGMTWDKAHLHCAALPAVDGQAWRMPTISELRSLIRGCAYSETGGPCGVSDECLDGPCHNWYCNGCAFNGGPADGCYWPADLAGACNWYWSSSRVTGYERDVWGVFFRLGFINSYSMDERYLIRCVRP